MTGNTIVDAIDEHRSTAAYKSKILSVLNIRERSYAILTAHREENVDDHLKMKSILQGAKGVAEQLGMPVIFPIHPRTKSRIEAFGLNTLINSAMSIEISSLT